MAGRRGGWLGGDAGTVTLAAAMSLPLTPAQRDALSPSRHRHLPRLWRHRRDVAGAGDHPEWVIRRLGLREDDSQAIEEGWREPRRWMPGSSNCAPRRRPPTMTREAAALGEVIAEYERRLVELTTEGETASAGRRAAGRRHRLAAVHAERHAIDDLWRRNVISDEVHRPLQQLLDYEESMLLVKPSTGGH